MAADRRVAEEKRLTHPDDKLPARRVLVEAEREECEPALEAARLDGNLSSFARHTTQEAHDGSEADRLAILRRLQYAGTTAAARHSPLAGSGAIHCRVSLGC